MTVEQRGMDDRRSVIDGSRLIVDGCQPIIDGCLSVMNAGGEDMAASTSGVFGERWDMFVRAPDMGDELPCMCVLQAHMPADQRDSTRRIAEMPARRREMEGRKRQITINVREMGLLRRQMEVRRSALSGWAV